MVSRSVIPTVIVGMICFTTAIRLRVVVKPSLKNPKAPVQH